MKNKFLKSEGLALLVIGMFTWCVYQYYFTGSKIIFTFEAFWFLVIVGFVWYGMYKRLEEIEKQDLNLNKPIKN